MSSKAMDFIKENLKRIGSKTAIAVNELRTSTFKDTSAAETMLKTSKIFYSNSSGASTILETKNTKHIFDLVASGSVLAVLETGNAYDLVIYKDNGMLFMYYYNSYASDSSRVKHFALGNKFKGDTLFNVVDGKYVTMSSADWLCCIDLANIVKGNISFRLYASPGVVVGQDKDYSLSFVYLNDQTTGKTPKEFVQYIDKKKIDSSATVGECAASAKSDNSEAFIRDKTDTLKKHNTRKYYEKISNLGAVILEVDGNTLRGEEIREFTKKKMEERAYTDTISKLYLCTVILGISTHTYYGIVNGGSVGVRTYCKILIALGYSVKMI